MIIEGKPDIFTYLDCPDLKHNIQVWGTNYSCDICINLTVDGRNAHDCSELRKNGYNGKYCPRGYRI